MPPTPTRPRPPRANHPAPGAPQRRELHRDAGGYTEALVVFYSRDELYRAFRANTIRALDDIE